MKFGWLVRGIEMSGGDVGYLVCGNFYCGCCR